MVHENIKDCPGDMYCVLDGETDAPDPPPILSEALGFTMQYGPLVVIGWQLTVNVYVLPFCTFE
jgi:hypothetical protein